MRLRLSSSFGRSIRYRRWAPFPESPRTGAGNPKNSERNPATFPATSRAAACSASEELIPLGRTGSMSTGNHSLRIMSASAVVASFSPNRVSIRFDRRESRAGLTGFRVT